MRRTSRGTAFYLETLLLICAFVAVILVLTWGFASARQTSQSAGELTDAVHLARCGAEAAAGAETPEEIAALLLAEGAAEREGDSLTVRFGKELEPDPAGPYRLHIAWDRTPEPGAGLVTYEITVTRDQREIYTLETAVNLGRDGA